MLKVHDFLIVAVCITGMLAGMLAFYWEFGLWNYLSYDQMQRISLYSFFITVALILASIMKAVDRKEPPADIGKNKQPDQRA